jgi:hypothetical protein
MEVPKCCECCKVIRALADGEWAEGQFSRAIEKVCKECKKPKE